MSRWIDLDLKLLAVRLEAYADRAAGAAEALAKTPRGNPDARLKEASDLRAAADLVRRTAERAYTVRRAT